jgi:hypothetical protein
MNTLLRLSLPVALAVSLAACGGSGDDDVDVPTGSALPNIQFMDTNSYFPLEKLRANGQLFRETDADYGTKNPRRKAGDSTLSVWAIDTSAKGPSGEKIEYSMRIDTLTADGSAYNSMVANLKIDASTGLIFQQCSGFPICYDNGSGRDQDFRITAIARFAGSKEALERSFVLRVVAN